MRPRRALVGGLLAGSLIVAACADGAEVSIGTVGDTEETSPPTTDAPSTTVPASTTTTEPTTTSVAEPVIEVPDFGQEWTPGCRNISPAGSGSYFAEVGRGFGPLGAEPSVVVQLPTAPLHPDNVVPDGPVDEPPYVTVASGLGGVVLGLVPGSGSDADSSMVVFVDYDGEVRWSRCFDARVEGVFASPSTEQVLVATNEFFSDGELSTDWSALSVLDGSDADDLGRLDGFSLVATSRQQVLVGKDTFEQVEPNVLQLISLRDLSIEDVPLPTASAEPPCSSRYALTDDGQLLTLTAGSSGNEAVAAVWAQGSWQTDAAARSEARPVHVTFECPSDDPVLVGLDADGAVLWRADGVRQPGLEGAGIRQERDVAVVIACTDPVVDGPCGHSTLGVDAASGAITWVEPGFHAIGLGVDSGLAILAVGDATDPDGNVEPGWVMVDARTGEEAPGQRWEDPLAFYQGCCGEGEYTSVHVFGRNVVVVYYDRVAIWEPIDRPPLGLTVQVP